MRTFATAAGSGVQEVESRRQRAAQIGAAFSREGESMQAKLPWLTLSAAAVAVVAVWVAGSAGASPGISQVPRAGTGSPVSGATSDGINGPEFANDEDEADTPAFDGTISLSDGGTGPGASSGNGPRAKSDPSFNNGFEGLNHYQQRYSHRGNQFRSSRPTRACASVMATSSRPSRRDQCLQHVGAVCAPG